MGCWQAGAAALLLLLGATSGCGEDSSPPASEENSSTGDAPTGGSDASDGSSTDAPAPSPYDGEPLPLVEDGEWHWVEIDGMQCADGRPSGVGVRAVEGSDKLVLYFKGGGACFNTASCAVTAPLMLTGTDAIADNPEGILDFGRDDNPLEDYNVVYFPYCTGDIHSGAAPATEVEGVSDPWDFVGRDNVLAALDRVGPTFPTPEQLAVIGTSAGGLGALANYPSIAEGWPSTPTVVLDDSGLIFRDEYLRPCLQQQMREVWGLGESLPPCPECDNADGGGLSQLYVWLAETYPETQFGLIGANRDEIIRVFFGFGNDECADTFGLPDLGAERLTEALTDLQAEVLAGNFATYIVDGETHTWTTTKLFYTATSGGVAMRDWVDQFLAGQTSDVAPAG